ncbi:LemA family protein [Rhodothermus marinus SG0.5JP17-172]|uniref:LemA family protein n=1 Tax=Rhodothermus marinus TaxID=29549 RepID=UPI000223DC79|nr:LemA family protein [Rhodothermus marinus]AEN73691.1 LemA family protein [Rhodothermus marinus SG0.5JP17-172]
MRSKGLLALVVVVLLLGMAGCAGCSAYNRMVEADEMVARAWADLQAQYQRRANLIPNLVRTVQASANFERETLEAVTNARARATSITLSVEDLSDPEKVRQFQEAQAQLSSALARLLAVAENYPQLQTTEAFRDLLVQLEGTENRIAVARRDYNEAVRRYNTLVRRFPTVLVASLTGFAPKQPFEAAESAQEAPEVEFDL